MSQYEKIEEEDLFCDFIEKELQALKTNNKKELQRKKFTMINGLINNLYEHKNSREHFNRISNQVILLLNVSESNNPLDIFFTEEEDNLKDANDIFGDILKSEL